MEDLAVDFHVIISEANLPPVEIVHPQPDSVFVIFTARVVLTDDIQRRMLEFGLEKRNELFRDVRTRLLSGNIEFTTIGAEAGTPRAYELFSRFFVRDNTLQDFWETYVRLKSAVVMITALCRDFVEPT
jgi:hypothetical protein